MAVLVLGAGAGWRNCAVGAHAWDIVGACVHGAEGHTALVACPARPGPPRVPEALRRSYHVPAPATGAPSARPAPITSGAGS